MSKPAQVKPVKLVIGFIFHNEPAFKKTEEILKKKFGRIDFKSRRMPFDLTNYYDSEFGPNLSRIFISFHKLINPSSLYNIKSLTNHIETSLSIKGRRLVNIDPGYLDLAKVILASTKDYCHRVYLNKGIFAEVTLSFREKSFTPNQWSYPDFKKKEYIDIFNQIRAIYKGQL